MLDFFTGNSHYIPPRKSVEFSTVFQGPRRDQAPGGGAAGAARSVRAGAVREPPLLGKRVHYYSIRMELATTTRRPGKRLAQRNWQFDGGPRLG